MHHLPYGMALVQVNATLHAHDGHVLDRTEAQVARMTHDAWRGDVGDVGVGNLLEVAKAVGESAETTAKYHSHIRVPRRASANGRQRFGEQSGDVRTLAHRGDASMSTGVVGVSPRLELVDEGVADDRGGVAAHVPPMA